MKCRISCCLNMSIRNVSFLEIWDQCRFLIRKLGVTENDFWQKKTCEYVNMESLLCISDIYFFKSTEKRQFWGTLSGSRPALRSKQNHAFFCSFSAVFCWFQLWNHWKMFKINKKDWKRLKNYFDQLLGACSTQKLVEIHNK